MFSNQSYPEYGRGYEPEPEPRPVSQRCQCGDELPGRCPGVKQCPYAVLPGDSDE